MPDRRWEKAYDATVSVLLALALPFCFIWTLTATLEAWVFSATLIRPWHYLLFAGAGALKMVLDRVIKQEHTAPMALFREILLVGAGAFGLVCLVSGEGLPFPGWPPIGPVSFYLWLAVLVQWFLAFRIDLLLLERSRLAGFIRAEALRGENREALRRSAFVGQLGGALRNLKLTLFLTAIALAILVVVAGWLAQAAFGRALSGGNLPAAAVFLAVEFVASLAVSLYGEEQRRFSEGLFAPRGGRARRFLVALPILVFSVALALLAAGDRPVIDLSPLRLELPKAAQVPPPQKPAQDETMKGYEKLAENLKKLGVEPSPEFKAALQFILYALLAALVGLFIVFPFFSRRFREALKAWRPWRSLKKLARRAFGWACRLAAACAAFLERLFGRARSAGEERTQRGADGPGALSAAAGGIRAERETNRIVRLFRRLQRWAAGKKIYYIYGQTAAEYVAVIAGRFPAGRERLADVLAVFERALFSAHLVGRDDLRAYAENIRAVTRLH
jgi:hypothetical protein